MRQAEAEAGVRVRGTPTGGSRAGSWLRTWRVLAAVGVVWIVAYGLGVLGPAADLTFPAFGLFALIAMFAGPSRFRPSPLWPWRMMALAVIVFMVGTAFRVALETLGDLSVDRSLVPDLVTIPGYLALVAGLGGFVRSRARGQGRDIDSLLDSLVASLAALALAWAFLISPALAHAAAPLAVRLTLSAYPPLSVFLVALATTLAFSAGHRTSTAQRLLLGATVLMLAGDVLYMLVDVRIASLPQRFVDLPYLGAELALALTVLHPTMQALSEPASASHQAPGRARLALVGLALGIPAFVSLNDHRFGRGDRVVVIVVVTLLTVLAVWRMFRALRAHARSEARFAHQATHDALTGLPNRVFAIEHLHAAIQRSTATGRPLGVLFIDLDRFKLVNDSGGHSLGDALLVAVSERLAQRLRRGDVLTRVGGDEFVVILEDVSEAEALALADDLRSSVHAPLQVRGSEIYAYLSIGVALSERAPTGDLRAESLIRDADTAMYQAKAAGRDGFAVFDVSMRDRVAELLALSHDLRGALANDELHVHFQPIVGLVHQRVEGLEALLRWSHSTRGLVPPDRFIPIAEDTGLIVEIGAWVVDQSCNELARWRAELDNAEHLHVAVNLSARQLRDTSIVGTVASALARSGLPGDALHLEITESQLMEDPTQAASTMHALRGLGVHISMDDFGTGYSSLAYLKGFPIDHVKIDRSFVSELERPDTPEESLVAAVIAMARALDMTTVAEGIENERQAQRLRTLGADLGQGFLYSRPLPPALVPAALQRLGLDGCVVLTDAT